MTRTLQSLILCLLAFAAACQPRQPQADTPQVPPAPGETPRDEFKGPATPLGVRDTNSAVIGLSRGVCFGFCPVYSLEVSGAGKATFMGERNVATMDTVTADVSRQQIVDLLRAFERARYREIPDRYGIDKCHDATDLPSATTSLRYDGQSHTVDHYHGCLRAPLVLDSLEQAIDNIVNTHRWIGEKR